MFWLIWGSGELSSYPSITRFDNSTSFSKLLFIIFSICNLFFKSKLFNCVKFYEFLFQSLILKVFRICNWISNNLNIFNLLQRFQWFWIIKFKQILRFLRFEQISIDFYGSYRFLLWFPWIHRGTYGFLGFRWFQLTPRDTYGFKGIICFQRIPMASYGFLWFLWFPWTPRNTYGFLEFILFQWTPRDTYGFLGFL